MQLTERFTVERNYLTPFINDAKLLIKKKAYLLRIKEILQHYDSFLLSALNLCFQWLESEIINYCNEHEYKLESINKPYSNVVQYDIIIDDSKLVFGNRYRTFLAMQSYLIKRINEQNIVPFNYYSDICLVRISVGIGSRIMQGIELRFGGETMEFYVHHLVAKIVCDEVSDVLTSMKIKHLVKPKNEGYKCDINHSSRTGHVKSISFRATVEIYNMKYLKYFYLDINNSKKVLIIINNTKICFDSKLSINENMLNVLKNIK